MHNTLEIGVYAFFYLTCLPPLQWALVLTLRLLMSYIYDISSLRVNDLTLILLTWRKW